MGALNLNHRSNVKQATQTMSLDLFRMVFVNLMQRKLKPFKIRYLISIDWFERTANFYHRIGSDPSLAARHELKKMLVTIPAKVKEQRKLALKTHCLRDPVY